MHEHYIAHLDISTRNLLTDDKGHYACIDYELSRQFDSSTPSPQIQGHRATEIPPEFERGEMSDPYKADIWALAVLILQTCKVRSRLRRWSTSHTSHVVHFLASLADRISHPGTATFD